jgi:folate-binding protein YgfZ
MSDTTQTREDASPSSVSTPASIMIPATPAGIAGSAPLTPLAATLNPADQRLIDAAGARTFSSFTDAASELSALTTAAAAFDRGTRMRIRITGEDRVRWLNGMVTNTVKALPAGAQNYTFVLNAQGRIQGDATVFAFADHLILETDRSQSVHLLAHFEHFIIMDDVELAPVHDQTTLGLAGPAAASILTALQLPVPAPGSFVTAETAGLAITLSAEETVLVLRFSLWIAESEIQQLWAALLAAGATPAGTEAVHALRVLEGTPLYGVDISEKTLAQETGQARALNFNKGCYLGQEIVERVRSRANVHRGIRQFALHGAPAAPGMPILADGASIGDLTSIAQVALPAFSGQLALGTVRTEALDRGAALTYPDGTAEWLPHPPLARAGGTS